MRTLLTNQKIPPGEASRLSVYLRGWTVLNQLFQLSEVPDTLLEKLMTLEKHGRNRPDMLARLAGRYLSNQSVALRKQLGLPAPKRQHR